MIPLHGWGKIVEEILDLVSLIVGDLGDGLQRSIQKISTCEIVLPPTVNHDIKG
jgi:hypothetical protein